MNKSGSVLTGPGVILQKSSSMKHILPLLAVLLLTVTRLHAQGICDSTISILPIQSICAGTGETYLSVSHPGGVFSGPGLIYNSNYLSAQYLTGGIYTAKYTITGPGGCTVSATRPFEVRQAEQAFAFASGDIDCSNPNSSVMLDGFVFNNNNYWDGEWYGPPGSGISFFNSTAITDYAGAYQFLAYPKVFGECPAYANVMVNFQNNPIHIKIVTCTDCDANMGFPALQIKIDTVPPGWNATLGRANGPYISGGGCVPITSWPGLWTATIKNDQNGCISQNTHDFPSVSNAHPHVSAGTYAGIQCGVQGHLLGAVSPGGGSLNIFWTTTDGHFVGSNTGLTPLVDKAGTYTLTAVNPFTGCSDSDVTVLTQAPSPLSSQLKVICDGESFNGHTQSGTYFDTTFQANGCFKTVITKLFVLAPLQDNVIISPDNGQMNGSIQYSVTQGVGPFTYEWSTGDTTPSIYNIPEGIYMITVTDGNGCHHTREITVPLNEPLHPQVADREAPLVFKARLYPNPVVSGPVECTLEIYTNKSGHTAIEIKDVLGRTISSRSILLQEGKNVIPVSGNLAQGVYSILMNDDLGRKEVLKLMVAGGG